MAPSAGETIWVRIGKTDHPAILLSEKSDNEGFVSVKWTNSQLIELVPVHSMKEQIAPRKRRKPNRLMNEKISTDNACETGSASSNGTSPAGGNQSEHPGSEGHALVKWTSNNLAKSVANLTESASVYSTKEQIALRKRRKPRILISEHFRTQKGRKKRITSSNVMSAAAAVNVSNKPNSEVRVLVNDFTEPVPVHSMKKQIITPSKLGLGLGFNEHFRADKGCEHRNVSSNIMSADVVNTSIIVHPNGSNRNVKNQDIVKGVEQRIVDKMQVDSMFNLLKLQDKDKEKEELKKQVQWLKSDKKELMLNNEKLFSAVKELQRLTTIMGIQSNIKKKKIEKKKQGNTTPIDKKASCRMLEEVQQKLVTPQAKQNAPELELESIKTNRVVLKYLAEKERVLALDNRTLNDKYKNEIKSLNREIDRIYNEKESVSDELGEAQQKFQFLISEKNAFQLELESLKSEYDKFRKDEEEWTKQLEINNVEQASRNEELEKLTLSLRQDLEEKEECKNETRSLNTDIDRIYNEKESVSDELGEAQQKFQLSISEALQLELESLKSEYDKFRNDKEDMIKQNKTDNAEQEEKRNILVSRNEELEKLVLSLRQDLEEKEKCENEIKSLNTDIDHIYNEKESVSDELGEAQQKFQFLISEKNAFQLELESLKSEYDRFRKDKEEIKQNGTDNVEQEEKRNILASRNEELEKLVLSLRQDLDEKENKVAHENQNEMDAFNEVESALQRVLSNKATHDELVHALDAELTCVSKDKENLNSALNKMQHELESCQVEQTNVALELDCVKKEKDQMSILLDEKEQELETNQSTQHASMLTMKVSLQQILFSTTSIEAEYRRQIQALNAILSNTSNQEETSCMALEVVERKRGISQIKQMTTELNLKGIHVEPSAPGAVVAPDPVEDSLIEAQQTTTRSGRRVPAKRYFDVEGRE